MAYFNTTKHHDRRVRRLLVVVLTTWLGIVCCASNCAAADANVAAVLENAFVDTIARAERSVVAIVYAQRPDTDQPLDESVSSIRLPSEGGIWPGDWVPTEFGTGFIIAPTWDVRDRMILTCYHVIRNAIRPTENQGRILVSLPNKRVFSAQIIAADPRSDLAVLKSAGVGALARPLPWTFRHREARKGQFVVVLGNPYAIARDGSASASWGMISNIARGTGLRRRESVSSELEAGTLRELDALLQIDARLYLGSSGSPVLNLRGELIGVATSLAMLEGYEKSGGFALPLHAGTTRVIDELTRGYEVQYGFLGVGLQEAPEPLPENVGNDRHVFGAKVRSVVPNSPGARAGLQPGDTMFAVNDVEVAGQHDMMREIGYLAPGAAATLRVWRKKTGKVLTIRVPQLGKWPRSDKERIVATQQRFDDWRGIRVDFPTGRTRFYQKAVEYPAAVVVTQIQPQSSAAQTDLTVGDFISHVGQTPVATPSEFHRAVNSAKETDVSLTRVGKTAIVIRQ